MPMSSPARSAFAANLSNEFATARTSILRVGKSRLTDRLLVGHCTSKPYALKTEPRTLWETTTKWGSREMDVDTEIGRRVHRVVGKLTGTNPTPLQVLDVVHDLWRQDPLGGSTSASARLRCATAASVYFQRCSTIVHL